MTDAFTEFFLANPGQFARLDKKLNADGYMTDAESESFNKPIFSAVTAERYLNAFNLHNPAQSTSIKAETCCFETSRSGWLYGAYDTNQYADFEALKKQLRKLKILR